LKWKLEKFARRKYIELILVPMIINFITHLLGGIFIIENLSSQVAKVIAVIHCIFFVTYFERQLNQLKYWKLIFNYFNYFDLTAIGLGFAMAIQILIGKKPSEYFIAYSTTYVWINVLSHFRFYEPIGVPMIVFADMFKGISWFLLSLAALLLGFTYIPFILSKDSFGLSFKDLEDFMIPVVLTRIVMQIVFLVNVLISLRELHGTRSVKVSCNIIHNKRSSK
jgi:hypothetical protein